MPEIQKPVHVGVPSGSILRREPDLGDLKLPGGVGVTNDTSREAELGVGKWAEAGGRSFEELARSLPNTPIRELTIEGGGLPWGLILFVASLVFMGSAWWVTRDSPQADSQEPVHSQVTPQTLPTRVVASAEGAEVTVTTNPDGALITFDDQSLGRAPTRVPVPRDTAEHTLCAVKDRLNRCRTLTAEDLLTHDPLHMDLTTEPPQ
jgi:hypothetical protein